VCVPGDPEEEDTGEDTDDGTHPMVPDEYKYLWNTDDPCTVWGGTEGHRVYILATDVRAEADGSISGTERWFWFFNEPGWDDDCVDTFTLSGQTRAEDYGQYECSQCEEGFEITRTLSEDNCSNSYTAHMFAWDWQNWDDPGDLPYVALLMMDTLSPNGNPNEDNKALMVQAKSDTSGEISQSSIDNDFATGHAFPDNAASPGPPSSYDWLGEHCLRDWSDWGG